MMNGFKGTEAVKVVVESLVRWVKSSCEMHEKRKRTRESGKGGDTGMKKMKLDG